VNNYNRHITIKGCHIHESGANGIAFVGDPATVRNPIFRYGPQDYRNLDLTPGPMGDNYPMSCLVHDCIIERTGRTEKQTSSVQISMSRRITISHCSIYDVPRAGINISEGTFGGHVIEYCDVFNTVLETGDHGSFNSWGRDRFWDPDIPTMNREMEKNPQLPYLDMPEPNIIRNSRWRCDHGWDIDLDDGSSQYQIYNNLLLNGGIKLREGYYRRVWNNIVVNNGLHPHVWPGNNGDVITRNIFFTAHKAIAMNRGMKEDEKWGKEIDYNVFASSHADRLLYARNSCDAHSIVADPGFRDPESGDFNVDPAGEVFELGFRNFDMQGFGVLSARLKTVVKTPVIPELHMEVDGKKIEELELFIFLMEGKGKHRLTLVRNQKEEELILDQEQSINKVLIIGIDGCRPDALLAAQTPNMDKLWKDGAYTFKARTDEISSSGPAWSAMLIGVWHQKHNVLNNDYENPDLEHYPHFFHHIRQEKPELKTYSVAN